VKGGVGLFVPSRKWLASVEHIKGEYAVAHGSGARGSIRMHLIFLTRGKLDAYEKQILCQVFALLAGV
jgi:hypothetical protein